ncbi:CRISPR-associated helicase Cas3' [Aromatoleum diolicum]|uniref:CRISPR-associated helicase Cas3 n=1 Tax=Aromatoleum diolicum TaxID=75796 RepID=A0ABX1QDS9_9RHOO|nr:CRISPR-associated helicase Cas3' [Aromatoleum diolicum]NMG75344.1 CRISPR-associated helicase Cas3' [Aromatoleum diolicum]
MTTARPIWAKTAADGQWHPLLLHCLDVAAVAQAILHREPRETRQRYAHALGMSWDAAQPWLLLLIAAHDLGKACPGFQCKWKNLSGLDVGRNPNTEVNHAFVSQVVLTHWLRDQGWSEELARLAADAVGCHHGSRASSSALERLEHGYDGRRALGGADWEDARAELLNTLQLVFQPTEAPGAESLSGPDFMLLAGLTSFADWIGSNTDWFGFADQVATDEPDKWFGARRINAEQALDAIGWQPRTPLASAFRTFNTVFGFSPRPLQQTVAETLGTLAAPTVLLVEAPMGEGKTEAALFAHLELQRRFGHRGLYIALPTQATGNAMFARTLAFLQGHGNDHVLDLQLLHGGAQLNNTYQQLRLAPVYDSEQADTARVRASEWFTYKKRALLSEYGVGTVDQALLTILPVRHHFVRLWGLANRVVVFDEIHAYDAYTGTLLIHLVRWLHALGSSVVLLSATLPPAIRRKLAEVVGAVLPDVEAPYPRLSTFAGDGVRQTHFTADPTRRLTLEIEPIGTGLDDMQTGLGQHLAEGGMGLALLNTVQRAQELYGLYPAGTPLEWNGEQVGKRLDDGTELYLFHARFPASQRQVREQRVLNLFGKSSGEQSESRSGRKILIATQVAEQSLDLDFDIIATDLAPIDLLLQRAGRLWRHRQPQRPVPQPVLLIAGLAGDAPGSFSQPLWWSAVYAESILLSTWFLLRKNGRQHITLPDDIDPLVRSVYEEEVVLPETILERMDKALAESDGTGIAKTQQAHMAIIGLPDDGSWDDPARYVLYDDDNPFVHRTLAAETRVGDESLTVIPLWPGDEFDTRVVPTPIQAHSWSLRGLRIGRNGVVRQLKAQGIPEPWQQSPLLRNHFPLCLDAFGAWLTDPAVRLDRALGLVYESLN